MDSIRGRRGGGCAIEVAGVSPRRAGLTRRVLAAAAEFFAEKAAARRGEPFRAVALVLQDDEGSAAAHLAISGVEGPTDAITQEYLPVPPEPPGVYGELYLNAQRAAERFPRRRGWSAARELLLYAAHGFDHLSGADDATPRERAAMRRRELHWIARWTASLPFRLAAVALAVAALFSSGSAYAAPGDWAEYDFERACVAAQGAILLPQGGADVKRRLAGATVRAGWYADDFLAAELSVAQLEDRSAFALRGLWHWWGYEKFDPFFTFGAACIAGIDSGPCAGWGFFWHFGDTFSFRFDADAAAGIERDVDALFSLAAGIQISF